MSRLIHSKSFIKFPDMEKLVFRQNSLLIEAECNEKFAAARYEKWLLA